MLSVGAKSRIQGQNRQYHTYTCPFTFLVLVIALNNLSKQSIYLFDLILRARIYGKDYLGKAENYSPVRGPTGDVGDQYRAAEMSLNQKCQHGPPVPLYCVCESMI